MVTIGIDPHKQTHCAVAVDEVGRRVSTRTAPARPEGFGQLIAWARALEDTERVWVIEDCCAMSGGLERFLLDHGESVVRLAPHLMADARTSVREHGKSDPIDGLAVARAALREGIENLPVACLTHTPTASKSLSALDIGDFAARRAIKSRGRSCRRRVRSGHGGGRTAQFWGLEASPRKTVMARSCRRTGESELLGELHEARELRCQGTGLNRRPEQLRA